MKRGQIVAGVAALVLLGAGSVFGYYWVNGKQTVATQDASVEAPAVTAVAPAAGSLDRLAVTIGEGVRRGQVVGRETVGKTVIAVTAPVDGTVAAISAQPGQMVAPGTPLFTEVVLTKTTVVANVPETEIRRVRVGDRATITVSALPGVALSGRVEAISPTTQSFFSLIPTSATSGSYSQVVQRIPVVLSIRLDGHRLLPGESCRISIDATGG